MNPRPLTRRYKTGDLYTRHEDVEQQLENQAHLSSTDIIARARKEDPDDAEYVREEILVYWIREYLRLGQTVEANDLATILIARCTPWIQRTLSRLGIDQMNQAAQDVLSDIIKDIANLHSNRADYLEVRFWRDIKFRVTNTFNAYTQSAREYASLSMNAEASSQNGEESAARDALLRLPDTGMSTENQVLSKEALAAIPEPYRTAFTLHQYGDWPIESRDPGKQSISRYFNKTPRTIQNWLHRAEQALHEWRKEEQ